MTSSRRDGSAAAPETDRSWLGRLLAPRSAPLSTAPAQSAVKDDAQPYQGGSGRTGVLVCHGFTGSPRSMRPWAEYLAGHGFRVSLPRLPGHGTSWQEMNLTTWEDWYGEVDRAFVELRRECDQVFLAGLSMGGCLALRLAEQHGDEVAGLALVNPAVTSADRRLAALPVLKYLTSSIAGIANDVARPDVEEGGYQRTPLRALASMTQMWREVGANLARIDQPLLLFTSVQDHVVDPSSATMITERVSSTEVVRHSLERSYHVATLDYDADFVFAKSTAFFTALADRAHETRSSGDSVGSAEPVASARRHEQG